MEKQSIILVADNQKSRANGVVETLDVLPAKTIAAYSAKDALEILSSENVDCLLTELNLDSSFDGLMLLDEAKKINPDTEVIIITVNPSLDTCKESVRHGASTTLRSPSKFSSFAR